MPRDHPNQSTIPIRSIMMLIRVYPLGIDHMLSSEVNYLLMKSTSWTNLLKDNMKSVWTASSRRSSIYTCSTFLSQIQLHQFLHDPTNLPGVCSNFRSLFLELTELTSNQDQQTQTQRMIQLRYRCSLVFFVKFTWTTVDEYERECAMRYVCERSELNVNELLDYCTISGGGEKVQSEILSNFTTPIRQL